MLRKVIDEMKCERVLDLLPEFVVSHGKMPGGENIAAHLRECEECSEEFRLLERTGELLNVALTDPAPDQWDWISSQLALRPAGQGAGVLDWFNAHKFQSILATAGVTTAIAIILMTWPHAMIGHDVQPLYSSHASLSWNEPFADRAGQGLVSVTQQDFRTEYVQ